MSIGILTDLTLCVGCGACAMACKEVNGLPPSEVDRLSATTWCALRREQGVYVKRQCMHCLDPTCASVCPVGALHATPSGAVAYDADKCMGCRYCIMACPFDIPKYQWDEKLPVVTKCVLCGERRLDKGLQPACTEVCPAGATVFGERAALVQIAKKKLSDAPRRYIQHIYGLTEAGGTSVLYLSGVEFAKIGLPTDVLDEPYPQLTWQVLSKIPYVASVGGLSLFGVWWAIERRMKLAAEKGATQSDPSNASDDKSERGGGHGP